jgi:Putative ATPase subunit of terminase (gpP-like)
VPRHHRGPTEQQVDEAVRLYGLGWSSARIAGRLGFNQATIWRHLTKRGVVMRGPNDWQQPEQ